MTSSGSKMWQKRICRGILREAIMKIEKISYLRVAGEDQGGKDRVEVNHFDAEENTLHFLQV